MRVLVTGARGMLGSELVRQLQGLKHPLDTPVKGDGLEGEERPFPLHPPEVIGVGREEFDVTDRMATLEGISGRGPDLIIHAAAYADVDGCERDPERARRVNGEGARHVCEAAVSAGARVIYISTDYVFGGDRAVPYREEDPPHPLSVYGATKLQGEQVVQELLADALIIRTSWLFGGKGNNFVRGILTQMAEGRPLRVVADQIGCPTYTRDLVRAILYLIGLGARGILHVSNRGQCSRFEFAREIVRLGGGQEAVVQPIPTHQAGRPARRPAYSALDCGRFCTLTGFPLRTWQEAVADYLQEERWR